MITILLALRNFAGLLVLVKTAIAILLMRDEIANAYNNLIYLR